MASILIDSLSRLYRSGKLTKTQIAKRVAKGTITPADYEAITSEAYQADD